MSGLISDMPIRVCPSCTAVFIEDDRMYLDSQLCPRCGTDLSAGAESRGGGAVRTVFYHPTICLSAGLGAILGAGGGTGLGVVRRGRWN